MAHGKTTEPVEKQAVAPDEAVFAKRFARKREEIPVNKLFRALVKIEGSDLHLKVGKPPLIRERGELKALNRGPIDAEEMLSLLLPMMDDRNRRIFDEEGGDGRGAHLSWRPVSVPSRR